MGTFRLQKNVHGPERQGCCVPRAFQTQSNLNKTRSSMKPGAQNKGPAGWPKRSVVKPRKFPKDSGLNFPEIFDHCVVLHDLQACALRSHSSVVGVVVIVVVVVVVVFVVVLPPPFDSDGIYLHHVPAVEFTAPGATDPTETSDATFVIDLPFLKLIPTMNALNVTFSAFSFCSCVLEYHPFRMIEF